MSSENAGILRLTKKFFCAINPDDLPISEQTKLLLLQMNTLFNKFACATEVVHANLFLFQTNHKSCII